MFYYRSYILNSELLYYRSYIHTGALLGDTRIFWHSSGKVIGISRALFHALQFLAQPQRGAKVSKCAVAHLYWMLDMGALTPVS
jgi:hypothetical protein